MRRALLLLLAIVLAVPAAAQRRLPVIIPLGRSQPAPPQLTGIDALVPDPHFEGGGLHQIEPGGHLKVHADFNRHPRTGLARRLNALIYLNRDWKPEYGGALGSSTFVVAA